MSYEKTGDEVRFVITAQDMDGSPIGGRFDFMVNDIIGVTEYESDMWEFFESTIDEYMEQE